MPIPVSVTGFATSAGAHSEVAGSTNIDLVPAGTAPRAPVAAAGNGLAAMMNIDATPVVKAAAPVATTAAASSVQHKGEVMVTVKGLDFCYPATGKSTQRPARTLTGLL